MNAAKGGRIFYAASTCQLSYSLQTAPSVLQTSVTGAESSVADLTLTIFNNTASAVTVAAIVVTLPVGDDPASLVADVSSITPNAAPSSQWTVSSPSFTSADTNAAYTLLPQSGASAPLAAGAAIVVTLAGVQINHFTGTASIAIDETTSAGAGSTAIAVTKYPPGFFFDGLLVNVVNGSELQPVAQVAYNSQVTLSWNVSALDPSAIAIFYSSNAGQQGPFIPPQVNQSAPIAIVADTVFTVIVTTTAASGEPVVSALSTSVSVQQPDAVLNAVQAQTLTVAHAATLAGPVSATAGAAFRGGIATDTLAASGAVSAAGPLRVTGNTTLGQTTLAAASVTGLLAVEGSMRALGTTFRTSMTPLTPNWVFSSNQTSPQDGFWVIFAPGCQSLQFVVDGYEIPATSDCLMLPIRGGVTFNVGGTGATPTTFSMVFIPLGGRPPGPESEPVISLTTHSEGTGQ